MNIRLKTLAAAAALIVGIASAPAADAHETSKPPASMMDQGGMMGQGGHGGDMGKGGHGGQMSQMMATCNQMMQARMRHHQEKSQNPGETPKNNEG